MASELFALRMALALQIANVQFKLNEMNFVQVNVVTPSAVDRFIDEMGLITQQDGGPRIAGRIFGLLIVEGRELSLNQISERLGVSRASVSTNARRLSQQGLLRLTTHAGDRQDYYEVSPGTHVQMLQQLAGRMEKYARIIDACAEQIESESEEAAQRVADLSAFYKLSAQFMGDWIIHLHDKNASLQD